MDCTVRCEVNKLGKPNLEVTSPEILCLRPRSPGGSRVSRTLARRLNSESVVEADPLLLGLKMFEYIFGKHKRRDELDNKVIDEVVGNILMSSSIRPGPHNSLAELHAKTARWYKTAKERTESVNAKASYIWKNNNWRKKK